MLQELATLVAFVLDAQQGEGHAAKEQLRNSNQRSGYDVQQDVTCTKQAEPTTNAGLRLPLWQ